MTVRIQYAYLKQQTWLYRRNYPADLQPLLGSAFKQSLKTGDARLAKVRAAEVNAKYEEVVSKARAGVMVEKPQAVRISPPVFAPVVLVGRQKVRTLSKLYLNKRSDEMRPGGFKSVRFGVGLFVSACGERQIGQVSREDVVGFVRDVAALSANVGKSEKVRGYGLDQLVKASVGAKILPQTQRRIVTQVGQFLDWAVYEGELASNPFSTVRVEGKEKVHSYVAPTNEEVVKLLALKDARIADVFTFCLLSGMRSGEAVGLVRGDLVWKGNLGWFAWVRPNEVRQLKTDAAERFIPLHSGLMPVLAQLPTHGRLFPQLDVSIVTKRFKKMTEQAGVPEHFTASIVGHQSARSENRMTYGIYSAGISDEQKRDIVEKVGLPWAG
jgi:site-specific recombinase XerD